MKSICFVLCAGRGRTFKISSVKYSPGARLNRRGRRIKLVFQTASLDSHEMGRLERGSGQEKNKQTGKRAAVFRRDRRGGVSDKK